MQINFAILLSTLQWVMAQKSIAGKVIDASGIPFLAANVYLEGTYDGASTDEKGRFAFEISEIGTKTLILSRMGYEPHDETTDVDYIKNLKITMLEAINTLTGVNLTAVSFDVGDNLKVSVLKPLDIAAALKILSSISTVNEDGRLFVRGGDAGKTQVLIEGLSVFQPFNVTANNIPTRARFSPFLFKGITFSTGD